MAQRHIHYEAAFEDYVRSRGWPYVPVDEQRKAIFGGARIKSFDYLIYRPAGPAWIVDIKGRKFPYDGRGGKRYWENWVTREDIEDLHRWDEVFGDGFEPVFVFTYWLIGLESKDPTPQVHAFRGQHYAFLWVSAAEYGRHARGRSPKWNTVSMPTAAFRKLAKPIYEA